MCGRVYISKKREGSLLGVNFIRFYYTFACCCNFWRNRDIDKIWYDLRDRLNSIVVFCTMGSSIWKKWNSGRFRIDKYLVFSYFSIAKNHAMDKWGEERIGKLVVVSTVKNFPLTAQQNHFTSICAFYTPASPVKVLTEH